MKKKFIKNRPKIALECVFHTTTSSFVGMPKIETGICFISGRHKNRLLYERDAVVLHFVFIPRVAAEPYFFAVFSISIKHQRSSKKNTMPTNKALLDPKTSLRKVKNLCLAYHKAE